MDSIEEILMDMELKQLVDLYEIVQDSDNKDDEKLLSLYNRELERIYGEGNIKFLDFAQMEYLCKKIEQSILYKI